MLNGATKGDLRIAFLIANFLFYNNSTNSNLVFQSIENCKDCRPSSISYKITAKLSLLVMINSYATVNYIGATRGAHKAVVGLERS
jgi:hypothetical protein